MYSSLLLCVNDWSSLTNTTANKSNSFTLGELSFPGVQELKIVGFYYVFRLSPLLVKIVALPLACFVLYSV